MRWWVIIAARRTPPKTRITPEPSMIIWRAAALDVRNIVRTSSA
jgi:hypothetical protein